MCCCKLFRGASEKNRKSVTSWRHDKLCFSHMKVWNWGIVDMSTLKSKMTLVPCISPTVIVAHYNCHSIEPRLYPCREDCNYICYYTHNRNALELSLCWGVVQNEANPNSTAEKHTLRVATGLTQAHFALWWILCGQLWRPAVASLSGFDGPHDYNITGLLNVYQNCLNEVVTVSFRCFVTCKL